MRAQTHCLPPRPARVTPEESFLGRILQIFMQTVTLIRPIFVVFYLSRHFNSTTTLALKLSSIHPPEFCSTREKSDSWLHIINREMLLFNFAFSALMNTNYVMQIRLDRWVFYRHTIIPVQPCPGTITALDHAFWFSCRTGRIASIGFLCAWLQQAQQQIK